MSKYSVGANSCNCHPETCCCNDWAIYSEDEKKHSTYFHKYVADEICTILNMNEGLLTKIALLEKDKLRLDWLEANNACTEDPGVWTVTRCDLTKEDRVERFWVGAKLREAIDKARPSSPIQEKGMSVYNRLPRLRSPRQHRRSNVAVVICCGLILGVLMAMYI